MAIKAGVPVVPGSDGAIADEDDAPSRSRAEIGYPVMIKAAAGGGGRGMRVARNDPSLVTRLPRRAHRGRGGLRRRRGVPGEVRSRTRATSRSRSWATNVGNLLHLGERDCSVQRRHQKLIEESPSPALAARDCARR